ncbi:MAG: hypothetical protein NZ530_07025, partial [Thermodesulfobacteriaceae bacterium]|nr:hypothetical protein [Thermodesulfobacteriaceae bacterium]
IYQKEKKYSLRFEHKLRHLDRTCVQEECKDEEVFLRRETWTIISEKKRFSLERETCSSGTRTSWESS